jgi:hypothetical protein
MSGVMCPASGTVVVVAARSKSLLKRRALSGKLVLTS